MPTKQEIFDKVATHLLTQKARAMGTRPAPFVGEVPSCLYLAPDGTRCAIGCLIPDGHPALRAHADAAELLMRFPDLCPLVLPTDHQDAGFLLHLQRIHDDRSVATWPQALREFAQEWNLTLPPILQEQPA